MYIFYENYKEFLLFELFEKYPNVHTSFCIQNGNLRDKAREINLTIPKKIAYNADTFLKLLQITVCTKYHTK